MKFIRKMLFASTAVVFCLVKADTKDPQIYVARTYDIDPPFVHQHVNIAVAIPETNTYAFDRYTETMPLSSFFQSNDKEYSSSTIIGHYYNNDTKVWLTESGQSVDSHGMLDAYCYTISPQEFDFKHEQNCYSLEPDYFPPSATPTDAQAPDPEPYHNDIISPSTSYLTERSSYSYFTDFDQKSYHELAGNTPRLEDYSDNNPPSANILRKPASIQKQLFEQELKAKIPQEWAEELSQYKSQVNALSSRDLAWELFYTYNVQKKLLASVNKYQKNLTAFEPEFGRYYMPGSEALEKYLLAQEQLKQANRSCTKNFLRQVALENLVESRNQELTNLVEQIREELEAWQRELIKELEKLSDQTNESRNKQRLQDILSALQSVLHGETKAVLLPTQGLDKTTIEVLRQLNINYTNFGRQWGNQLQNVVHKEFLNFLPDACSFYVKSQAYPNIQRLAELAIYGIDTARECNDAFKPRQAVNISSICFSLMDYSKAVGRGVYAWGNSTITSIAHPIDTAQEICSSLQNIATLFGSAIYYGIELAKARLTDSDDYDKKIEVVLELYRELKLKATNISGPEMIERATPLVADVILFPKFCSLLGKLCKTALAELRSLKITNTLSQAMPGN
ncbi:MAG TPA: hypothetical protein VHA52_07200, partial [Candidatus Babeliaceae bacterium]|nr:hypothetical protein [Candidatus Babeliaceae bacterium]